MSHFGGIVDIDPGTRRTEVAVEGETSGRRSSCLSGTSWRFDAGIGQ